MEERHQYMLYIWREKPKGRLNFDIDYWKVHVKNAPRIPEIGELIESLGFGSSGGQYRVFDVVNPLGGALTELITEKARKKINSVIFEDEKGLVRVLAFSEHIDSDQD